MDYVRRFEQAFDVHKIAELYDRGMFYRLTSMENFAQELGISIGEVTNALYDIEDVYNILLEVDSYKDVVINPYGFSYND
jgi:hypothetical protein